MYENYPTDVNFTELYTELTLLRNADLEKNVCVLLPAWVHDQVPAEWYECGWIVITFYDHTEVNVSETSVYMYTEGTFVGIGEGEDNILEPWTGSVGVLDLGPVRPSG